MRKLYACIIIVVAVICIGIAVERYSTEACASGVCVTTKCYLNSVGCVGDCYCAIPNGETVGRCILN